MDITDITFLSLYPRSDFRVIYYNGVFLIFQQMNKVLVSFPPLPSISYFLSFWTFYLFLFIFYFFGLLMTETKKISTTASGRAFLPVSFLSSNFPLVSHWALYLGGGSLKTFLLATVLFKKISVEYFVDTRYCSYNF